MIEVTPKIFLSESELDYTFITSPGPGGQNVNKVATGVQLRFDVRHSPSLPEPVRQRLIALLASKLTLSGELVIKATSLRTQERNKQDALDRLLDWIKLASIPLKKRKKTKPTYGSVQKRLNKKKVHSTKKALRRAL